MPAFGLAVPIQAHHPQVQGITRFQLDKRLTGLKQQWAWRHDVASPP